MCFIACTFDALDILPWVRDFSTNCGRSGGHGARENGSYADTLATLEISIARTDAKQAAIRSIAIHAKTH